MSDTNVGLGMVSCRKGCRCFDCEINRMQAEISRLTENQRLQDSATAAVMERAEKAEAELAACREDGTPLYLWKNGDHYLAFTHEYPCFEDGDPMTFGEPAARAIFKASHNGRRKEGA